MTSIYQPKFNSLNDVLNSLKINIDTYLTKEGIQNIVNKLRD